MRRFFFAAILIVLVVGVCLGLWLGGSPRELSPNEREHANLTLQLARSMLPFRVAFRALLGGVILFTLGGLGWGAVRWLNRRVDTVYPDRAGLYPVREGRIGRAKVFHDPNRNATGTTVYAPRGETIVVRHPMPEGYVEMQQQVTGQAQVTQALRAAVSGPSSLPTGQGSPFDRLGGQRTSRPLPEVREFDIEPAHIERLLLEDGGSDSLSS